MPSGTRSQRSKNQYKKPTSQVGNSTAKNGTQPSTAGTKGASQKTQGKKNAGQKLAVISKWYSCLSFLILFIFYTANSLGTSSGSNSASSSLAHINSHVTPGEESESDLGPLSAKEAAQLKELQNRVNARAKDLKQKKDLGIKYSPLYFA